MWPAYRALLMYHQQEPPARTLPGEKADADNAPAVTSQAFTVRLNCRRNQHHAACWSAVLLSLVVCRQGNGCTAQRTMVCSHGKPCPLPRHFACTRYGAPKPLDHGITASRVCFQAGVRADVQGAWYGRVRIKSFNSRRICCGSSRRATTGRRQS